MLANELRKNITTKNIPKDFVVASYGMMLNITNHNMQTILAQDDSATGIEIITHPNFL